MCDNLGQFSEFTESHNVVIVGGDIPLQSLGSGMVSLNCVIPHGRYSDGHCHEVVTVVLHDVLYVPTLGHCLVSWNALRGNCELRGVRENDEDYLYV